MFGESFILRVGYDKPTAADPDNYCTQILSRGDEAAIAVMTSQLMTYTESVTPGFIEKVYRHARQEADTWFTGNGRVVRA
jgi:hypothetical protein